MPVSARNVFKGTVSAIVSGAVNAEVELLLPGGDALVAIVTESSVRSLGLREGKSVLAFVKAPWVTLLTGEEGYRFSARNQLSGEVFTLVKGAVSTEVGLRLSGGNEVFAVVTNEAAASLGLREGGAATALIKASHIILGVED